MVVIGKSDTGNKSHEALIRRIWLNYYNNVLLDKGLITKDEHRRMRIRINHKYPLPKR